MSMSKTVVVMGTILLSLLTVCVTILVLLGKDPSVIVTFAASTIIPTAGILYVGQKAEKAQNAAETTVQQTNGRMTELIDNNRKLSQQIAVLTGATVTPTEPPIDTLKYGRDENGALYLKKDA